MEKYLPINFDRFSRPLFVQDSGEKKKNFRRLKNTVAIILEKEVVTRLHSTCSDFKNKAIPGRQIALRSSFLIGFIDVKNDYFHHHDLIFH